MVYLIAAMTLSCAFAAVSASAVSAGSRHPVVERCPFDETGGADRLSRGFYISNFSGPDIHSVMLEYTGTGTFTVRLAARLGTYDGELLGKPTQTVDLTQPARVRFKFGNVPVPPGSTVTFIQHATGDGEIFYNIGRGPLGDETYAECPGVTETTGHRPPLGHFRRGSVGLVIRA
jgi:hypothetical protein